MIVLTEEFYRELQGASDSDGATEDLRDERILQINRTVIPALAR
jgi:hypothetical protein